MINFLGSNRFLQTDFFKPTQFSTRKALRVEVFGVLKPTGMFMVAATIANKIRCTTGPV